MNKKWPTSAPPFPISGSVGDLTFYTVNGKTYARNKPGITREKFLTHPKLQRSRENAQNFGGASKLACAIYRDARGNQRGTASPYAHNQLIARICRGMNRRTRAVEEITFMDVAHLLRGIDLSRGQEASKRIAVTTIGPNHNPTSLRISDIPAAASLAQGRHPGRIECRIQLNYIRFPQVALNDDAKWDFQNQESLHLLHTIQSDWIPTEILPTNGLTSISSPIPLELPQAIRALRLALRELEVLSKGSKGSNGPKPNKTSSPTTFNLHLSSFIKSSSKTSNKSSNKMSIKPRTPRE
ncbi:MAG: hypothetical protein U0176_07370 [Bacteroidia bacterium]